ncbi:MAG: hypothetical protein AAF614_22320 [Chloroflexota bacterium]
MKLTARQEAFLNELVTLYQNDAAPIHYTTLAKQLDVNRYTAYDMLKVLEKKGYVASHYRAKEGHVGPGRSEVVFMPTKKADHLFQRASTYLEDVDLETAGPLALFVSPSSHYQWAVRLLNGLMPDETKQIRYCVELLLVLLLSVSQSTNGRSPLQLPFPPIFCPSNLPKRPHLTLLSGLLLGLVINHTDTSKNSLLEHTLRYQAIIFGLSDTDCQKLSQYLQYILRQYVVYSDSNDAKHSFLDLNMAMIAS